LSPTNFWPNQNNTPHRDNQSGVVLLGSCTNHHSSWYCPPSWDQLQVVLNLTGSINKARPTLCNIGLWSLEIPPPQLPFVCLIAWDYQYPLTSYLLQMHFNHVPILFRMQMPFLFWALITYSPKFYSTRILDLLHML
jgi:hypothetical protein